MRPFGFAKKDFIRIQEGIARDIYEKALAGELRWGGTKRLIEERKKTYPWLKESTIQYYLTKLRKQPKPLPLSFPALTHLPLCYAFPRFLSVTILLRCKF